MNPDLQKNRFTKVKENGNLLKRLSKVFFLSKKNDELAVESLIEENYLIEGIKHAKKEWMNACTNFDYADDNLIVDYYIYKIKACQVRYEYFLKKAKASGIKVNLLEATNKS